jgi:hypothetical protein
MTKAAFVDFEVVGRLAFFIIQQKSGYGTSQKCFVTPLQNETILNFLRKENLIKRLPPTQSWSP